MSEFQIRPAVRVNTPAFIALAGPSGSGKTRSALELATGLAGDGKILLGDTEGNRALHYADLYAFDHVEFRPPYSPERCAELIDLAESKGYAVLIVDSGSDEYEGEGGLQEIREQTNDEFWARTKARHKHALINRIRRARIHTIWCLRCEERVRISKVQGRTVVEPLGWSPICEKRFLYEMQSSFRFDPERPGVPVPIKLYDIHAKFFPDRPVTRDAGRALAAWAAGAAAEPLLKRAEAAADGGTQNLREFYRPLSAAERDEIQPHVDALKARAAARDRPAGPPPSADSSPADDAGFPNAPPGDTPPTEHAVARDLTQQPELQKGGRASGATRSAESAPPRSFTRVLPQRRNGKFDWPATREALLTAIGEIEAASEVAAWVEVQQGTLDLLPSDDRRAVERALNEKVALMGMGDGQ